MRVRTCVVIDAQSWVHSINTPLIGSFSLKTLSLLCFFQNADVRICLSVAVKTFRVAQELWPQFPGNNFKVLSAWQEPLQSFELWYKVKSHGPYIFFRAWESSLICFITKCCLVTLLLASWNNSCELFSLSRCERAERPRFDSCSLLYTLICTVHFVIRQFALLFRLFIHWTVQLLWQRFE